MIWMSKTFSVSDLKNDEEILKCLENGVTVELTENGQIKYVLQTTKDYERLKAEAALLAELSIGLESYLADGGMSVEEAFSM